MDAKKIAEFDQNLAQMRDTIPAALYAFYQGCYRKGFSEKQSMYLTSTLLEGLILNVPQTKPKPSDPKDAPEV